MDYKSVKAKTVDEYMAALAPKERKALQAVRRTVLKAAPGAEEVISYGMPGYKLNGYLVGFAAFTDHLSFFAGTTINEGFAKQLKGFEQTKGGIHFTPQHPLPASLITRIVKARARDNEQRQKAKKKK